MKNRKYKDINDSISKLVDEAKTKMKSITEKSKNDNKIQNLKKEYYSAIEKSEHIKDEIIGKLEEKADNYDKKDGFSILGIKPWKLMAYFVIYSFLGFCLETIYGMLTKGVLESRQSFLYGPFCGIYGFGAVLMILFLQFFMKNNYTLFFSGYVVGSIIEYFVSLFGELILHVKWWDYSTEPFNINGRVCAFYSIAWGILAIYLMRHLNPNIEAFINKIKIKLPKYMLPIVADIGTAFLIFDAVISIYGLNIFYSRLVYENDINIPNQSYYISYYEKVLNNEKKNYYTQKYFSNEKMLKTYPNLKIQDKDENIIFVKNILKDIKPYYIKLFTPKEGNIHLTNIETVDYSE